MTPVETRFFKLVDRYARSEFQCMLTEMFIPGDGPRFYVLCFRPITTSHAPEKSWLCCYSEVEVKQAMDSAWGKVLTDEIVNDMNQRLAGVYESAQQNALSC